MSTDFRIGLLGHGTVGGAFETLLGQRADHVAAITGLRPRVTGVLTRNRGDFDAILADCDLIVEVIGGIEPARDYVLRAMRAGRGCRTCCDGKAESRPDSVRRSGEETRPRLRDLRR